jgi:hypothetical protein
VAAAAAAAAAVVMVIVVVALDFIWVRDRIEGLRLVKLQIT